MKLLGLMVCGVLGMGGCVEQVDSSSVRTSGIYANIWSETVDNGDTEVRVQLRVGGSTSNTYVELTDGDALYAYLGEDQHKLNKDTFLGIITYTKTLADLIEGTEIRVAFERVEDEDATESFLTVPKAFSIDTPTTDQAFSREQDAIDVGWSPTDNETSVELDMTGECIVSYDESLANDTGTHTVMANTLQAPTPAEGQDPPPDSCDVTLEITRTRTGTVDAAYGEGGHAESSQVRSTTFESNP